uniref:Uncharacterized protein n=1 Tax=Oryza rufipogon TaxID=4529 RepID=A0A0E0RHY3_ORYRU
MSYNGSSVMISPVVQGKEQTDIMNNMQWIMMCPPQLCLLEPQHRQQYQCPCEWLMLQWDLISQWQLC